MVARMNNEIKSKRKNPSIQKLCTFFAFYLVISNLIPQIRAISGYYISMFLSMFLWLFFAALAHPSFFVRLTMHKFIIFFYILYTVTVPYIFGNGIIGNRYLEHSVMLILYLIYMYNNTYGYTNSSKLIIKFSLISMIITSVTTFIGLINNPYLARSIKSSGEYTMILRTKGIGGYEFIYMLVFVSIILFFILYNKKLFSLKSRFFLIIMLIFILFVMTIIYANYFTAFLMLLASIVLLLVLNNRNILTKVFILFMAIILLIFRKSIFEYIISSMINFLESGATVEKLVKLQAAFLGYNGNDSIFLDRASTILLSWNSFLENLLGGLIVKPIGSSGGFLVGFGQHSHFMDTFALYGLVIGILNVYIILYPFFIRFKENHMLFSLNLSMLMSVLIIFSLNNVTPSIGFVIFFMYPVFYDWVIELKKYDGIR